MLGKPHYQPGLEDAFNEWEADVTHYDEEHEVAHRTQVKTRMLTSLGLNLSRSLSRPRKSLT